MTCHEYGIRSGCDKECPTYKLGDCEIQEENKKLFERIKQMENIKVNDILITKDGRKIGNCIVISNNLHKAIPSITVMTDYGNRVLIHKNSIKEMFHSDIKQANKSHKHYVQSSDNTYCVRLEFNVKSTDFMDVEVNADSVEEAKKTALDLYYRGDLEDLDMYSGDHVESEIDLEYMKDWYVVKIARKNSERKNT